MKIKLATITKPIKYSATFALLLFCQLTQAADPVSQYIVDGNIVPKWVSYVGNSMNWFIPVKNGIAKTERKSLIVTTLKKSNEAKTLNLKWTGKHVKNQWGGNTLGDSFFGIGRHNIDLSSVEDAAAIAFDIKILRNPTDNVTLSMQCENSNKCKGDFPIKNILKNIENDKWQQLPIPLNCFNKEGNFNFKQVTTIFSLGN
ncbi:putative glycoside hydrolase [Paraglaciecola aquimarina]|uniref:Glycoside hydrolase n=1 Tax=Paraglaciecola aquimarina TaxID=1235557 RepID=A0ABU3SYM2_9ALTE|nr:putative glycoside hydrolase [Paraglaciecola aquimarina]MDU0355106.1 putative glycoside hydrolase [Paraglaciecola aquimarina]